MMVHKSSRDGDDHTQNNLLTPNLVFLHKMIILFLTSFFFFLQYVKAFLLRITFKCAQCVLQSSSFFCTPCHCEKSYEELRNPLATISHATFHQCHNCGRCICHKRWLGNARKNISVDNNKSFKIIQGNIFCQPLLDRISLEERNSLTR